MLISRLFLTQILKTTYNSTLAQIDFAILTMKQQVVFSYDYSI